MNDGLILTSLILNGPQDWTGPAAISTSELSVGDVIVIDGIISPVWTDNTAHSRWSLSPSAALNNWYSWWTS